jgi:hypothetical protein
MPKNCIKITSKHAVLREDSQYLTQIQTNNPVINQTCSPNSQTRNCVLNLPDQFASITILY